MKECTEAIVKKKALAKAMANRKYVDPYKERQKQAEKDFQVNYEQHKKDHPVQSTVFEIGGGALPTLALPASKAATLA
ncbi:hypothetical protein AGMMS49950_10230 [Endomicrobiia bacterium]|nr:hypothetical protein AGMMS49531_10820 [Endomicrobiia bacterium]GHT72098.1 hypothetical protein AGMMS49950_10230 [Endomicrobiia bacterium]